jgi:hypothetical protein
MSGPVGDPPAGSTTPAGEHDADSELTRAIEEFRLIRTDLTSRLDDEMAHSRELKRDLDQAQRKIASIYQSKTWAAGKALRRLARPFSSTRDPEEALPTVVMKEASRSDVVAAPPPREPHPLWTEYRDEVAHELEASGEGPLFLVSTINFGQGRGDLFVATGLGRYLRRQGLSAGYQAQRGWYQSMPEVQWLIAMMPAFRPSKAAAGPKIIGWARNEFMTWLTHPELDRFDVMVCSSHAAAAELERFFAGPVHVLPIGVDLDLFQPDENPARLRTGVVSTVNQWGRERDIYRALRSGSIDFPLRIHGQSRGLPSELARYDQGPVHFFELPKVYWEARVVLDDSNWTTVGWGAVNSRVFEAIAAGALPVTNSPRGLDTLGLADVPTYAAPEELNPLVDRLLGDPDGTQSLVDRLGGVVRERHSYEARARDFAHILKAIA